MFIEFVANPMPNTRQASLPRNPAIRFSNSSCTFSVPEKVILDIHVVDL